MKTEVTLKRERASKILIEEFDLTSVEVGKIYDVKKQLINKAFNENNSSYSDEMIYEVTTHELEIIKQMVLQNKYVAKINDYNLRLINDKKNKYAIIIKRENNVKVFFSRDIQNKQEWKDIDAIIKKNRLNELDEEEKNMIDTGTIKYITGLPFFEPMNRKLFHILKRKRQLKDDDEYAKFLGFSQCFPSKFKYTDDFIRMKIKESIQKGEFIIEKNGKLYIPPKAWIRNRCERQEVYTKKHLPIHEYIKIFGYEHTNHMYQKLKIKKLKSLSSSLGKDVKYISKHRIGQDYLRKLLLKKYNHKCCICGISNSDLLVASHIKTWKESTVQQRIDVNNALLLCSMHDALFDKYLITFDNDGSIIISDTLSPKDKQIIGLTKDIKISLNKEMNDYMKIHRQKLKI